tara:strand:- start:397 stop:786 length:390 start_codon:yes stop_codon:yes gene_type:complete
LQVVAQVVMVLPLVLGLGATELQQEHQVVVLPLNQPLRLLPNLTVSLLVVAVLLHQPMELILVLIPLHQSVVVVLLTVRVALVVQVRVQDIQPPTTMLVLEHQVKVMLEVIVTVMFLNMWLAAAAVLVQ